MTTNGNNQQQLTCRVNARGNSCEGCGQRALITLEWYSQVLMAPAQLARITANPQSEQELAVGKEMFTLCLHCLRRERYIAAWDSVTKLPNWARVETQPGPGHTGVVGA